MLRSILHTVIVYLCLTGAVRLMGKRQIGQLEASEFVVTMLAANLAALPIEDPDFPLSHGLAAVATILVMERLLSLASMASVRFRRLLCGRPVILIDNGKILRQNLRRTRVTLDELSCCLRQKDVLDVADVQFAILETNGSLSVFPYPAQRPASAREAGIRAGKQYIPYTIISDGKLLKENLKLCRKDEAWVTRVLRQKNATVADTLLLTVDDTDTVRFYPKS